MIEPASILAGPRGRRLLLAYVLESQRIAFPRDEEWQLHRAVADAAYELDPGKGTSVVRMSFSDGIASEEQSHATPHDVAKLLATVPLAEPTPDLLRHALHQSVMSARYYQEPDGEDFLAASPPVKQALERVADHISQSPHIDWWTSGPNLHEQNWIWWDDYTPENPAAPVEEKLAQLRASTIADNDRAKRERPHDPSARYSGVWWSTPSPGAIGTSRTLEDGTPAGLWFTEDSGYDRARSVRVEFPNHPRIFEMSSGDDWAELCRRYPLDASWEKRHDWYRATGRVGKWVIPDWYAVAQEYDAVHLTVAGYLAASGTVISVGDDSASMISAWNPDETWWLVNPLQIGQSVTWTFDGTHLPHTWTR